MPKENQAARAGARRSSFESERGLPYLIRSRGTRSQTWGRLVVVELEAHAVVDLVVLEGDVVQWRRVAKKLDMAG